MKDRNRFFLSKTEICFVFAVQLGRRHPQSPNKSKKNKKTMTNICSSSKNETKRTLRSGHLVSFRVFNYTFFFQKPRNSKNALYYQKNLRFLYEIDQKVSIFVEKLKKMQPLKMTFRSQLEPSVKSYECFMFLLISTFKYLVSSAKFLVFTFKFLVSCSSV